ncbi:xanthine dehydrogenase YagR molybdenum-binding subunit [Saccharothrix coeruleofusca]|uniref:xanthine dehydrogenase family protein molybdopterin-binding subunit n=1 Tax=Saccharothrix coeruleofusca TaxID=33919 RepID=UPI001AE99D78|nr:xanthine dehydrogenase family protein molybdopterin-binding subunit [Saccharothrix coeruleofusca]MBP2337393.1 xanthine dehydrogenase YagR molybdenum-binding subunit [Saccharothrix coeruleofusca]
MSSQTPDDVTDENVSDQLHARQGGWTSPERGGPSLTRRRVLGAAGMGVVVSALSGPSGIASAARPSAPARTRSGPPSQEWIGAPLPRTEGPLKVRGAAPYAAEFAFHGMVYAALVFSTIAKGRIVAIDTSAAESAPGFVHVMSHYNAPRMKPMMPWASSEKAAGNDALPIMQDDRIRWNGQPIAVVLAETQEQADYAASLVRATCEAEAATTSFAQAKANGTETAMLGGQPVHIEIGDAEAALATAAVSVDATFHTPYQNHNAIEPHAVTVAWHGDELEVHDASQSVAHNAWSLATMLGIDEHQVHVTSPYVGGAFGGKFMGTHQVLAAAASRLAGRPVRLALSRAGVYRLVGGRALTEQRLAIGAARDGRFVALIHTGTSTHIPGSPHPELAQFVSYSSYATDTLKIDLQWAYLDMVANAAMRAPGEAVGSFALESAVDEVAVALGMDPIELRIRNEPATDPLSGLPFSSRNIVKAWRAGAKRFGWERRNPTPRAVREGDWLIGMGCGAGSHMYAREPGGSARLTLAGDGTVEVAIAAHDAGMGTATVQTQIIAEQLALRPEQVELRLADSALPGLVPGVGSSQTTTVAATMVAATHEVVAELLKLVRGDSPLAGLTADDVTPRDGGLAKIDDPGRHESYASILTRAGRDELTIDASGGNPTESERYSMYSYGAMFCEVRVNAVTGETRVSRLLGSMDCGRVMNARTAAGQFRGGMIMAMGLALTEETLYDERTARIMNPSLAEYHIPVHADVPKIDVIWTGIPDPHAPLGARGIGELSMNGTAAAIANAIYNATGKRVRQLPITLDKLL